MKKILVLVMAGLLVGCGTVGKTFPMPSTMKCLSQATDQDARNECMWTKAARKKD